MSLIQRLEEANKHLVGAREHHAAIEEVIGVLRKHGPALRIAGRILETARPLVLNALQVQDAERDISL